jgi:hypothetical protein
VIQEQVSGNTSALLYNSPTVTMSARVSR